MSADSRSSLLDAVNHMVASDAAPELFEAVTTILPNARAIQARFVGERAVLNPLVELAIADSAQFARVVALIEHKRQEAGLAPLREDAEPKYDKGDYMRDFMYQKRERERRAAEIENLMRPERDQLVGRSRLDFMQIQSAKWKAQRDAALEQARAASGSRLTREAMKQVIESFWARVDRDLNELEELAKAERFRVVGKK
jgi:hypothetical protein